MSLANLTNNILTEVNTSGVVVANGTAAPTAVAGTANQLLRRNGADTAYEFFSPSYIISGGAAGGELSGTYPNPTLLNSAVIDKVLTGYTLGANTAIASTDTILGAFAKVQGQINARLIGNETITLTGDVSGSGATNITTTIGALKVTNAMLAGNIDYSKMNASTVPTWNQNTTGSAASLTTARTINGVSFNGTANIIVPTLYNSTFSRITAPGGGEFVTTTATQTGAIRITLPRGMTGAMLRFTVKIYLYATNQSFEVNVGGYPYSAGNTWANNPFAYIVGNPGIDRRFNVRFGFDGTNAVIYIGELNSSWSYPQVFITDFQRGFSDQTSVWANSWSIGFEATAFQNITATVSNSQVGYAVSTNTANTGVFRNGSGDFSAGTITAALNGNASTATLAANSTLWNGLAIALATYTSGTVPSFLVYNSTNNRTEFGTWTQAQNWLGLGSNAYTSTAFLPLAGGTMTGGINIGLNDITNTNSVFARYGEFNNPGGTSGYFQANGSATYGLQAIGVGSASRTIFLAGHSGYSNGFTVEYNHSTPAMVYTMRNGSLNISSGDLVASGTLSAGSNSSALIYGGTALIINRNTAYTQIYRPDGTTGIFLGDADAGNYSDNTNHYFRSRDTSTTFLTLTAATATFTSSVNITNSTASTSTTTGSLRTAGGLGVVGAGHFGGNVSVTNGNGGSIVLWSQYSGSPAHPGIAVTNNSAVLTFSHNSNGGATLTTGTMTAASFIRNGGTSAQFLKADGSVDTNTYATTSSLGAYLPLAGGTLTGALVTNSTITSNGVIRTNSGVAFALNNPANTGASSLVTDSSSQLVLTPASGGTTLTLGAGATFGAGNVTLQSGDLYLQSNSGFGILSANATRALAITDSALTLNRATTITNSTASTSTTTGALVVTGGVGIGGALNTGGAIVSASNITAYSDVTLKENIYTVDNALEKTMKLRGVYYNRKDDALKTKKLGVVAQEIREVLPEVVLDNDGLLSVDYGNIVGVLIEAIKELKVEVEQLKQK